MKLRLPLVLTALAIALPGQNRDPDAEAVRDKRGVTKQLNPGGDDGEDKSATEDGKAIKMSPEEIANAGVRRGAGSLCKLYLHTKPARLMPGQSGIVIITAALGGQAVLPSPAPIELASPLQQGAVTLGNLQVAPAKLGQGTAAAYIGRPVYDNTARIEMPITVASNAVVGTSLNVAVELRFELFDGKSGQSIGKFLDRAMGQVEVGPSHDPDVRGGYTPPTAAPTAGDVVGSGDDAANGGAAKPTVPKEGVGAAEPLPVVAPPPEAKPEQEAAPSGPLDVNAEGGVPSMLLIGGGALLGAVVLLLVGKRK